LHFFLLETFFVVILVTIETIINQHLTNILWQIHQISVTWREGA